MNIYYNFVNCYYIYCSSTDDINEYEKCLLEKCSNPIDDIYYLLFS